MSTLITATVAFIAGFTLAAIRITRPSREKKMTSSANRMNQV